MVVENPDSLQVGINDGGSHEFESAAGKLFAHPFRKRVICGHFFDGLQAVVDLLPDRKAPYKCVETSELRLNF